MSSQRRCLVVYDHLPHYRYGVFEELDRAEAWQFTFAADVRSREQTIKTIPFERLNRTRRLRNGWLGRLLWQRGLLAEISRGYDSVIFLGNAANASTWVGAVLARILGCRVYFWTIGWHRPERGSKRVVRLAFYRLAHCLLLYGTDARAIGASMGHPVRRLAVIGNSGASSALDGTAVDVAEEVSRVERLSLPGCVWVGAVVRVNPEKRFHMLVDAISSLRQEGRDIGLLLVGDGPETESIRFRAVKLGVPIYMPGAVHSAAGLGAVYSQLKVSVLPERAGLTVIQSLSYGVPVVSVADPHRQVPEFRAIVPGITGELYRPDDVASLAAAVEKVLDAVADDPAGVAAACRAEVASRWSPRVNAEAIIAALDPGPEIS